MKSHEKTLRRTYEDLQIAKRSGDRDAIKEAQEKYERAVKNVTLNNDKYKAMLNETTAKLAHVNEVALSYINNKTPKIYTLNYNEFANQDIDGYTFTLVNENAVRNLIKTGDLTLYKHVDVSKDKAWNEKFINSQVLQGILQGESIDKIAKRVFPEINRFNKDPNLVKRNENSSIRIARTMVTAAENKGRQDSFEKAQSDGVIMERKWVAAYEPGRTRDWHLELNGVIVGVDEPFENSVGKIMYPGDPSADPSNVYNCRCAIRAIVKGFKWNQKEEEPGDTNTTEIEEQINKLKSGIITDIVGDNNDIVDQIYAYAERMSPEDVAKFNKIFNKAEFIESENGSHYVPATNKIELDKATMSDTTMYHESTHWFDFNQDYAVTDDWGHYERDENGRRTNQWIPDIVTIKEHVGFSEYIAYEWDKPKRDIPTTPKTDDRVNIVKKLGLSDTYGNNRNPEDVKNDLDAIKNYLDEKGISRTDPDFVHLSDFLSAMTYDASLSSLTTGGHDYNYWVESDSNIVAEITAGYNILKRIGRTDLIEIEKELAPKLMAMIEKEWGEIW